MDHIPRTQQYVVGGVAFLIERTQRQAVLVAIPGEGHIGPVGELCQTARGVDGIQQTQGDIGNRIRAGLLHFTGDIDFLATEGSDGHIYLRVFDVLGDAFGNQVTNLGDAQTFNFDLAHVGIKDGAVIVDPVTGFRGTTHGAGRNRKLRVIPDGNLQHITQADLVIVILRLLKKDRRRLDCRLLGGLKDAGVDGVYFHNIRQRFGFFIAFVFLEKPAGGSGDMGTGYDCAAGKPRQQGGEHQLAPVCFHCCLHVSLLPVSFTN